jgi:hypothetical protein
MSNGFATIRYVRGTVDDDNDIHLQGQRPIVTPKETPFEILNKLERKSIVLRNKVYANTKCMPFFLLSKPSGTNVEKPIGERDTDMKLI